MAQLGGLSVYDLTGGDRASDPNDDPSGWMKEVKTLSEVTVTAVAKKQQARPSFWDGLIKTVNGITGQIKLPKVETGVDNNTKYFIIGIVVLILAFVASKRK